MNSAANTSISALEARLEARLESVLEDIGQAYNTVEDRVHILESTSPTSIKRLGKLEETDKKIQEAINDLKKKLESSKTGDPKELEKKFQNLSDVVTKRSDGLSKSINEIRTVNIIKIEEKIQGLAADVTKTTNSMMKRLKDLSSEFGERVDSMTHRIDAIPLVDNNQKDINADVRTLLARVSQLESQAHNMAPRESFSISALADALTARLAQGDQIDNGSLARLLEVLPKNASRSKVAAYQTPDSAPSISKLGPSERASAPAQHKRTIKQSHDDDEGTETAHHDDSRPRKRARATGKPKSKSAQTPQAGENHTGVSSNHGNQEDLVAIDGVPEEEMEEAHEIRRSTRTPKPNKKHAAFLTWVEVRERRKTR